MSQNFRNADANTQTIILQKESDCVQNNLKCVICQKFKV